MRKWIVQFLFGDDEIAGKMVDLLETRNAAVSRHSSNVNLRAALAEGESALATHKNNYADRKQALEAAYQLVLD